MYVWFYLERGMNKNEITEDLNLLGQHIYYSTEETCYKESIRREHNSVKVLW